MCARPYLMSRLRLWETVYIQGRTRGLCRRACGSSLPQMLAQPAGNHVTTLKIPLG